MFSNSTPAQAQIYSSSVLLAQQRVVETLPLPPNIQAVPYSQRSLPQLQPSEPLQGIQSEQNFQNTQPVPVYQPEQTFQNPQSTQINQYSQNFERYFVYVDSSDSQTLQKVRRIEPRAYIRQYQGRNVIQSGVFSRASNAEQRVRELQSSGIYRAQIVGFADGQERPTSSYYSPSPSYYGSDNSSTSYYRADPVRQEARYFVIIPAKLDQLPAIADRIRQNLGQTGGVFERSKPRGPHVAVGPFSERFQAEQWNNYLRDLGYGNARVYYGK
ncbi:hypothetical protein WKK05_29410 [Nostoc sp. UHCC 0302]|uniref:hypothetical protein n=1 Tax=Nostoc sp. UHCC 0302 TaxID=3134896 RepID=UPI00311CA352